MEQAANSGNGARRNEDIALDLFKFIATTASVGRPAAGATGFVAPTASKAEDQVDHLLKLYARCLKTVSGQEPSL
ncbi:hypothetical protein [Silvibacterium acidisoli]|uniref:hypothetical protein n=1 Tax=Acidobacteriaceae bacterium ZG23-2 TaxID=2883246 RepID=UPI00406C9AD2